MRKIKGEKVELILRIKEQKKLWKNVECIVVLS